MSTIPVELLKLDNVQFDIANFPHFNIEQWEALRRMASLIGEYTVANILVLDIERKIASVVNFIRHEQTNAQNAFAQGEKRALEQGNKIRPRRYTLQVFPAWTTAHGVRKVRDQSPYQYQGTLETKART